MTSLTRLRGGIPDNNLLCMAQNHIIICHGFLRSFSIPARRIHPLTHYHHVAEFAYPLVDLRVQHTQLSDESYLLATGVWDGGPCLRGLTTVMVICKQDTQSGNVLAGIITLLTTHGARRKSRRGAYHRISQIIGCENGPTPVPRPTCQFDPPRSRMVGL